MDEIKVLSPCLGEEEITAVINVMKSGWIGLGPKTEEFEKRFANSVESRFMIALNSGTAALHLSMLALNIGPGDEVIVPSITFISTVHAVSFVGATPVFADVSATTLNISIADLEKKITRKTKALIVVHMGGHPCDMDEILEIAKFNNITVVEDAAHAAGAYYKGRPIGSISPLTCFSFHALKNLTCGEGGGITCNNPEWDSKFRKISWLGISKNTWHRSEASQYSWQYEVDRIGYKYNMNDIQAAIGIAQLNKLQFHNNVRRNIAYRYLHDLRDLNWLELPLEQDYVTSSWHLFQIKLQNEELRDKLNTYLKEKNISTGVHYYPCHLHPYYKNKNTSAPIADRIWKRILTLPIHPGLELEHIDYIIESIRSFQHNKS